MIGIVKECLNKTIYPNKYSSEAYVKYIRKNGAEIGDNVIIGAGSVVSGKIESNSVYAGNPAKRICSLEEHYQKLSSDYINSAKIFANRFRELRGRLPEISELELYTTLFVDKNEKYFKNSHIKFAIKHMHKKFNSVNELVDSI